MIRLMGTRESRRQRGRRSGLFLVARTIRELREARITANVSQPALARELDWSQARLWRMENGKLADAGVVTLSEMAAALGLALSVNLYPAGDPIRDRGQQALGHRFDATLSARWQVTSEALLPGGGHRAWDRLLRLRDVPTHLVGADLETRIRDIQHLVRRTRLRERDGQVDAVLVVLSDTAANRRLVDELRSALGSDYGTRPREILRYLRAGTRLPGSGVVLL